MVVGGCHSPIECEARLATQSSWFLLASGCGDLSGYAHGYLRSPFSQLVEAPDPHMIPMIPTTGTFQGS
jgi:hypothetical protein